MLGSPELYHMHLDGILICILYCNKVQPGIQLYAESYGLPSIPLTQDGLENAGLLVSGVGFTRTDSLKHSESIVWGKQG